MCIIIWDVHQLIGHCLIPLDPIMLLQQFAGLLKPFKAAGSATKIGDAFELDIDGITGDTEKKADDKRPAQEKKPILEKKPADAKIPPTEKGR